jgi:alkanesulfonate monooxygenase SsuD/methylene tetrahydromethanopterin reductase-like flavin-dependent oxidoreductase (luciferase family)
MVDRLTSYNREDSFVKQGVNLPNFGPFGSARAIAEIGRAAERAGWDGMFVWDHVVRRDADLEVVDPWVALSAAALATERLLLGPLVTPLARRRPWNVAKAAVSIDALSGGRFILGIGLGTTLGPEFPAFGEETDLRRRGDMVDEGLAIIRQAWSGEPVSFAGQHYRVNNVRLLPTPVRPGGIPVWGATQSLSGRPVRRAALLDGVFPIDLSSADLPTLLRNVTRVRGQLSDFDVVTVSADDDAAGWQAVGATWWLRELSWQESFATGMAIVKDGPR